jgi:hypothetical protein
MGTVAEEIANLIQQLEADNTGLYDESLTRRDVLDLANQLAILKQAKAQGGVGGGSSLTQAEVSAAINAATLSQVGVKATSASIDAIATSTTGNNYVTLPAGACTEILLSNLDPSAVDIEYRRGGAGSAMLLPFGTSVLIEAISNSSGISIRRADLSNTAVTLRFERRTR